MNELILHTQFQMRVSLITLNNFTLYYKLLQKQQIKPLWMKKQQQSIYDHFSKNYMVTWLK